MTSGQTINSKGLSTGTEGHRSPSLSVVARRSFAAPGWGSGIVFLHWGCPPCWMKGQWRGWRRNRPPNWKTFLIGFFFLKK